MKGNETKPGEEETTNKKQKVLFADEKTLEEVKAFPSTSLPAGQPNPIVSILSSLRSPSAPSRPREAFELIEEESPMKKIRPSIDSSKKAKINILKLLPTIFLQRSSKEDGAREGEGAFSLTIECLDVKGAFLQVPQEKPLKVILRGKDLLVKRNLPGQRDGAKACFDFSTEYFTEELNYQFSAECPCLGRVPF